MTDARDWSDLTPLRRELHRHAEGGWCEFWTSALVADRLADYGYQVRLGAEILDPRARMGVPPNAVLEQELERALGWGASPARVEPMRGGLTGVVGLLDSGRPGPVVGLRFDIDANDGLVEADDGEHAPARLGFRSTNPRAQHSCAHDGHTAIGLGVARALAASRDTWSGRVVLIFQPAEEGARGAQAMVSAGVLDEVEVFISGHIGINARTVGQVVPGYQSFQATVKWDASFSGQNAHAGYAPHEGRNALLAAATAVLNLHAISRHGGGDTRVNVGMLQAGEARNSIPSRALMRLEVRGASEATLEYMAERAIAIVKAAADMHGCALDLERMGYTSTTYSDRALVDRVAACAEEAPGVVDVDGPADFGAGDDAILMMKRVQERGGLAVYLGLGSPVFGGHHTPTFDFDEGVLPIGAEVFLRTALASLS